MGVARRQVRYYFRQVTKCHIVFGIKGSKGDKISPVSTNIPLLIGDILKDSVIDSF